LPKPDDDDVTPDSTRSDKNQRIMRGTSSVQ
jgi:hypothetical protein